MNETLQISKEIIFFLGIAATVIGFIWKTSQKETAKELKINELENQLSNKMDLFKKDALVHTENIQKDINYLEDKTDKRLKGIEDKVSQEITYLKKSNKMRKDEINSVESKLENKISQMKKEILDGIEKQNEASEKKHKEIFEAIKEMKEQIIDTSLSIKIIENKINKKEI